MATSKQEQLYNEIIKYFSFAEKLIELAENSDHKFSAQQFAIIEEISSCLEVCADNLACQFIDFVKNGESPNMMVSIRSAFNEISSKIEECRNKILILYA